MNNHKRAQAFCNQALEMYEHSLHGLLEKAHQQLENEDFEASVATLNLAKEHHPQAQQLPNLIQQAQIALKRSKTKDYYKVLGVANDADARQIKAAYRKLVKVHHPDKSMKSGISKEDAEKKMSSINEAYEVLSDPELRARFDRGDDPNSNERQSKFFASSLFRNSTCVNKKIQVTHSMEVRLVVVNISHSLVGSLEVKVDILSSSSILVNRKINKWSLEREFIRSLFSTY